LAKENKELKEKYNQTSHKLMEFKSQCEILKQDLKKSQKVLASFIIIDFDF
jgi:peptidoglycan hydrolase CwlO-like protein